MEGESSGNEQKPRLYRRPRMTKRSPPDEKEKQEARRSTKITSHPSRSVLQYDPAVPISNATNKIEFGNASTEHLDALNHKFHGLDVSSYDIPKYAEPTIPLPALPQNIRMRQQATEINKQSYSKYGFESQELAHPIAVSANSHYLSTASDATYNGTRSKASQPKPTIVLVPASFSGKAMYEDLVSKLESYDYEVFCVPLHTTIDQDISMELRPPAATMEDDASSISRMLTMLADEGKDILLAGHCYGTIPMTESCRDMTKFRRIMQGKTGGVVSLLYISGLIPKIGESMMSMLGKISKADTPISNLSREGDYFRLDAEISAPILYNDLPLADAVEMVKRMGLQSLHCFGQEITSEPWRTLPTSYVYCKQDHAYSLEVQHSIVEEIEREVGKSIQVYECDSGHYPNVTDIDALADIFRRAAGQYDN
ncbi:hypothetical protein BP6252_13728 [Coleophoma cylindrospora]|uniref:AB hydrolase-1 domain-containing protein n=1 Tax=Coleophoma cylindrospora TaxID=1849047 RepID=A0A3D8Q737_9HELO|nr:hypothetical protein BP6252_13728 [Coleophoma cylindrospora]